MNNCRSHHALCMLTLMPFPCLRLALGMAQSGGAQTSADEHDQARGCRVFFPPGEPPPGIHVSNDGASVAAPLCVMEWFISFFDACCELEESDSDSDAEGTGGSPHDGACEVEREARHGGGAGGQSCMPPQGTPPCGRLFSCTVACCGVREYAPCLCDCLEGDCHAVAPVMLCAEAASCVTGVPILLTGCRLPASLFSAVPCRS